MPSQLLLYLFGVVRVLEELAELSLSVPLSERWGNEREELWKLVNS